MMPNRMWRKVALIVFGAYIVLGIGGGVIAHVHKARYTLQSKRAMPIDEP